MLMRIVHRTGRWPAWTTWLFVGLVVAVLAVPFIAAYTLAGAIDGLREAVRGFADLPSYVRRWRAEAVAWANEEGRADG